VEETIELREQHATVERKAVNREVTDADMAAFKEGSFEIREIAEEPVIAKTARVVEEVVVDTEVTEHTETISDSVRRTDVDVDDVDGEEGKTATTRKSEKPSSR
jgi:stress response protein YsnF